MARPHRSRSLLVAAVCVGITAGATMPVRSAGAAAKAAKRTTKSVRVAPTTSLPGQGLPAEAYRPAQAFVKVEHRDITIQTRPGRTITVRVRWAAGAIGPRPFVAFSHGGDANPDGYKGYEEWATTLALAGYVVASPGHKQNDGAQTFMHCAPLRIPAAECQVPRFGPDIDQGQTLPGVWYERPRDLSSIVDHLAQIETASGMRIDRSKLAAVGHSAGAWTVMRVAGSSVQFSPSSTDASARDPRFRAYVAASPQGIGWVGMHEHSWDAITVPILMLTGPADVHTGETAVSRLDPWRLMPPGNKALMFLNDMRANHSTFGLSEPSRRDLEAMIANTAVAFLDAKVLDRPEAQSWLTGQNLATWSGGSASVSFG